MCAAGEVAMAVTHFSSQPCPASKRHLSRSRIQELGRLHVQTVARNTKSIAFSTTANKGEKA